MITNEKDFGKAVLRVWEIGDLIPRVVEQLSNPSPLRNRAKDCELLISLGKELCELSKSIPIHGQRMICDNSTVWSGISFTPTADVESITGVRAQEIDAMSEDEIDASVPDSSVKRAEELVRVKPTTGDMLLDIIKAHTEIAKAAYLAGRESN